MAKEKKRKPVDMKKINKELRTLIDGMPGEVAAAIYAGCDEFDFLRAVELLLQLSEGATMQLPPIPAVRDAMRSNSAAQVRLQELMVHVSNYNKAMVEVEELVKKGGALNNAIMTVSEAEARAALGGKPLVEQ